MKPKTKVLFSSCRFTFAYFQRFCLQLQNSASLQTMEKLGSSFQEKEEIFTIFSSAQIGQKQDIRDELIQKMCAILLEKIDASGAN